ncbi:Eco57I restriction-modification methylase domain-containing protein [Geodermatophilus africanus]|uniref:Eco57I restriction-modification methylase domain-containing protein n=1 Tax=Geodermatophilus africanus TaxID=1137993 RepID=UPI000B16EBC1|nr:class I SAM-dependent methyltransferase [Geodermatophilus africanus]
MLKTELDLIRACITLGALDVGGPLSPEEEAVARSAADLPGPSPEFVKELWRSIESGSDPLGDAFCALRDAATRRSDGAIYTPSTIVEPMVEWALHQSPTRVVDPGAGSGRFLAAFLRRDAGLHVIAIDLDPLATLMARATLAVFGARNARVIQADYTLVELPQVEGVTAFVGNPPYVRHHKLSRTAKEWAQRAAADLGYKISGLAGLHTHFILSTALLARPGDVGCFVTSAEWLDVNYGAIVRTLMLGDLGADSLHVLEPTAEPFEGTQTTAVITTFSVGEQSKSVRINDVNTLAELGDLVSAGRPIARQRLAEESRWSVLARTPSMTPDGFVQLGELCRVHRGTVTGANAIWVLAQAGALPDSVLFPSVTKARELFAAGPVLADGKGLKLVVDIPADLDCLESDERKAVEVFIKKAKQAGADKGYIASHRRAWWSVGLKGPAPILATYMARQAPAFVINAVDARHINIAHGLYPRQELDAHVLSRLAAALRTGVMLSQGRVYAGGLTKFEPKEMERLMVPDLSMLRSHEPISTAIDA